MGKEQRKKCVNALLFAFWENQISQGNGDVVVTSLLHFFLQFHL